MAATTKEVIISIETDYKDTLNQLARLKNQLDELKVAQLAVESAVKNGVKTRQEADVELEAIAAQMRSVQGEMRTYRKELDEEIKKHNAADGSLVQMREELKLLRREYEALPKAERDAAKGEEMLKHIQDLTDDIKDLEYAQRDFRRNVGNYMSAFDGMTGPLGKARKAIFELSGGTMKLSDAFKGGVKAVKGFSKELLKMMKHPYVAFIGAIVAILMKLVKAFKSNDEAMTTLKKAFESLRPIINVINDLIEFLVNILAKAIEGIGKFVTAIASIFPNAKETIAAGQAHVQAIEDLEDAENEYTVNHAKREAEIARLTNEANDPTKSLEERRDALQKALDLEKQDLEDRKKLAAQRLKNERERIEMEHDRSQEAQDNLARLEAAEYEAIRDFEEGTRRIQKRWKEFNKKIADDSKNAAKVISGAYTSALESLFTDSNLSGGKRMAYYKQWAKSAADAAKKALDEVMGDESKTETEKAEAQKAYADEITNIKQQGKDLKKDLSDQWKEYRAGELEAWRAYEDAVLTNMDESLEKQVELAKKAGEREIEDLRTKLKTDKTLTKQAREWINKTILEKERTLYTTMAKIRADYWSNERYEIAKAISMRNGYEGVNDEMNPTGVMFSDITKAASDALGKFDEFKTNILNDFQPTLEKMISNIKSFLEANFNNIDDEYRNFLSSIVNYDGFFTGTKGNMDKWLSSWETVVGEMGKQGKGYMIKMVRDISKPWLDEIEAMYSQMIQMPQKYGEQLFNDTVKAIKDWSKKVNAQDLFMLENPFSELSKLWGQQLEGVLDNLRINPSRFANRLDKSLTEALDKSAGSIDEFVRLVDEEFGAYGETITNSIAEALGKEWPVAFEELEEGVDRMLRNMQKKVYNLDWTAAFGDKTQDAIDKGQRMTEKWGTALDNSVKGVLKMISGLEDENEQLEWLAANYDTAIEKIREFNRDRAEAYNVSLDDSFYESEIDEGMITPILRYMADNMAKFSQTANDFDEQRRQAQAEYWAIENKSERDTLEYEARLSEIERDRNLYLSQSYQQRMTQLEGMRDVVANAEKAFIKAQIDMQRETRLMQDELEVLESRSNGLKVQIDSGNLGEGELQQALKDYNELIIRQNQLKYEMAQVADQYRVAAEQLKATGFSGVEDLENAIRQMFDAMMDANQTAADSATDAAKKYASAWLSSFSAITGGVGRLSSSFQSLFEEMGEENERWQKFAEAASYVTIGISMAEGIAEAVAAGAGQPFPYNLAAIASGVAAVVSAIASAMSTYKQYHSKSPKYATGGHITKGTTKKADDVPIWVSKGEYVIKADAVDKYGLDFIDALNNMKLPKMKFANGGQVGTTTIRTIERAIFGMDGMRDVLTEAIAGITPVVSVMEITDAQNRVRAAELNGMK